MCLRGGGGREIATGWVCDVAGVEVAVLVELLLNDGER